MEAIGLCRTTWPPRSVRVVYLFPAKDVPAPLNMPRQSGPHRMAPVAMAVISAGYDESIQRDNDGFPGNQKRHHRLRYGS